MAELNARIIAKASATTGEVPSAGDLEVAELSVNTADGKIFTKHTDDSIKEISGSGGGSGAVDSVNGETGVVSLGIQEMDDFDLNIQQPSAAETGLYDVFTAGSGAWPTNGGWALGTRISRYKSDGTDWGTELAAAANSPIWYKFSTQSEVYEVVAGVYSNSFGGYLTIDTSASGVTLSNAVTITIYLVEPGGDEPLAESDILQWDDTEQKFKPGQLPEVIDKATLKTEVAASTDFADFQSRIAAL